MGHDCPHGRDEPRYCPACVEAFYARIAAQIADFDARHQLAPRRNGMQPSDANGDRIPTEYERWHHTPRWTGD